MESSSSSGSMADVGRRCSSGLPGAGRRRHLPQIIYHELESNDAYSSDGAGVVIPTVTREDYMIVGLEVLADRGHLGLKLAEVCRRLGVTSGSFYHFFGNWADYRSQLIGYWKENGTLAKLNLICAEPDPRRRIERLVEVALRLNHTAEGAIRAWSRVDADVAAIQAEVDGLRHRVVLDSARQLGVDDLRAIRFADAALYLLIGYEQAALAPDLEGLESIFRDLLGLLESERVGSALGRTAGTLR